MTDLDAIRARLAAYNKAEQAFIEACRSDNNMRGEWDSLCKFDTTSGVLLDHAPSDLRDLLTLVDEQQPQIESARNERVTAQSAIAALGDRIAALEDERDALWNVRLLAMQFCTTVQPWTMNERIREDYAKLRALIMATEPPDGEGE